MRTHVRSHERHQTLKSVDARLRRLEARLPTIPAPELSRNKLPVQVSIIVPSTTDADKPMKPRQFAKRLREVKKWFDKNIGGETTIRAVGSYEDKRNKIIEEKSAIVESSMTRATYRKFNTTISDFVKEKRKEWSQKQVAMKVEGQVFFSPLRKKYPSDERMPDKITVT